MQDLNPWKDMPVKEIVGEEREGGEIVGEEREGEERNSRKKKRGECSD